MYINNLIFSQRGRLRGVVTGGTRPAEVFISQFNVNVFISMYNANMFFGFLI